MHTESQSHSALAVLAVIDERYGLTYHSHTVITYRVVLCCVVDYVFLILPCHFDLVCIFLITVNF